MEVGVSRVTVSKLHFFNLSFYGIKQCIYVNRFLQLQTLHIKNGGDTENGRRKIFKNIPKKLSVQILDCYFPIIFFI